MARKGPAAKAQLARRPVNPAKTREAVLGMRRQITTFLLDKDIGKAVDCLREGLGAQKKQQVGKYTYVDVPDVPNRLAAAKMILEYAVGKPTVTAEVTVNESGADFKNTSPSIVAARLKASGLDVGDILDAYTAAAKAAEPIDETDEEAILAETIG